LRAGIRRQADAGRVHLGTNERNIQIEMCTELYEEEANESAKKTAPGTRLGAAVPPIFRSYVQFLGCVSGCDEFVEDVPEVEHHTAIAVTLRLRDLREPKQTQRQHRSRMQWTTAHTSTSDRMAAASVTHLILRVGSFSFLPCRSLLLPCPCPCPSL
jgi:hypothetical protein